jgi:uncharacterized protein (TIGR02594 family)
MEIQHASGPAAPPWLEVARAELGVSEVAGAAHNPRILMYHSATTLHATADEVAWCSSFVNWCMQRAGVAGTRSAAARSWLQWGTPLSVPRVGAVMIYSDDARGGSAGHVGFFVVPRGFHPMPWIRTDRTFDEILGGNQRNQVCVQPRPRQKLIGIRWPAGITWPPPAAATT